MKLKHCYCCILCSNNFHGLDVFNGDNVESPINSGAKASVPHRLFQIQQVFLAQFSTVNPPRVTNNTPAILKYNKNLVIFGS